MKHLKIGLLREGKVPPDSRTPIIPEHAARYQVETGVEIYCESCNFRSYTDEEFINHGVPVVKDISHCDVLFGVKEVPVDWLLQGKTYFFFSHTIKKQPANRKLLQEILKKKIRLIDYEALKDENGNRLVAFGRFAGIVGAYNGILTFGMREDLFHLKPAHHCFDLNEMRLEYSKIKLPPIKIALTGGGRVTNGAMEVLQEMGISKVSPEGFLSQSYDGPVFTQLRSGDYYTSREDKPFNNVDFYANPGGYKSDFLKFAKVTDILMHCAYWDPNAAPLFTKQEMRGPNFKPKVIADISCDIDGGIPATHRATTIQNPVFDYNPETEKEEKPFSRKGNIQIMSIDNLPNELPRDASRAFSELVGKFILPALTSGDAESLLKRATIAENGQLGQGFRYLQDYVTSDQ